MPEYTCTHCRSTNDYGVVGLGPAVTLTCVACCAQFVPSVHVTEAEAVAIADAHAEKHRRREVLHRARGLPDADVACARDRLEQHVRKYPNYLDRDRDILLLRIYERIEKIELT